MKSQFTHAVGEHKEKEVLPLMRAQGGPVLRLESFFRQHQRSRLWPDSSRTLNPGLKTRMDINIEQLETAIQELKNTLKDGLLSADIWDSSMGLSLAGYNPQPAAVALFTDMTNVLSGTLSDSGFPGLNRYYFLELEGDHIVMVIRHRTDLLQGILMNSKKVNLGLLMSVVLPKMLASVEKARG